MAKDWGQIEPVRNQWRWPLSLMEEGDTFRVDWADKHPSQLRHYVSVRAAQLGRYFSVAKDDPEHAGFAKVTRVPPPHEREEAKPVSLDTPSEVMGVLIRRHYPTMDMREPAWTAMNPGQVQRIAVPREGEPKQVVHFVAIDDQWKFGVELLADMFVLHCLEPTATFESFTKRALADIMG